MVFDDATPSGDEDDDLDKPFVNTYHQEEADKHQNQADTDAAVNEDVLTNPRYDDFFADYQPTVRESFAYRYVMQRQRWVDDGETGEQRLRLMNFAQREAYTALWAIQQKKLFDLQCRWRAEEVRDVPGVFITNDFDTLSAGIENCTAVPPITPEELELYLEWVRQADYARDLNDLNDQRWAWQNYRAIREELAPDAPPAATRRVATPKSVPDWYRFQNQHGGNEQLLYLPDVRGQKEERIWDAWREGQQEQAAIALAAGGPAPDPRPRDLPDEEHKRLAREFAQRFEEPRLNRWRELSEQLHPPRSEEDREFEFLLAHMQLAPEPIPVAAGTDWREATRQAHYAYCHRKLLEYLPLVYEEYRQRLDWGIAQPCRLEWDPLQYNIAELFRGWLLQARARLGEPEDFDF